MISDNVKKGMGRAPNRSLFYALGLTQEELERPLVGIVSSHNEIVPGHMNIDKVVEAVRAGVLAAGGTPIVFPPSRCATASPWVTSVCATLSPPAS